MLTALIREKVSVVRKVVVCCFNVVKYDLVGVSRSYYGGSLVHVEEI